MIGFTPTVLLLTVALAAAVPAESAFKLNYRDAGNPSGIPIVLVHAFPLSQGMWDAQVVALGKTARVITFDVRGFGGERAPEPYTLEFVVDDLIGLLDRLKIHKAVICGLSMGGFVALRAAERNPERVRALVLADTKSGPDSDSSKLGRYEALKTIRDRGLPIFLEPFLKRSLASETLADKPQVVEAARRLMEANSPAGVSAALLALTSRTDTTPSLGKIGVPTLIIHGEEDAVFPVAEARALQARIPGAQIFLIPGAGHLSNLEAPQAFNERMVRFLADIQGGSTPAP